MARLLNRLAVWALAALLAFAPALSAAQPPKPAYVTGSITTGALVKASGPQGVTTGNLSGDCSTSGTLSLTCTPLLHAASNLSDLGSATTARSNLDVYSKAEVDSRVGTVSGLSNPVTLGNVTLQQTTALPDVALPVGSLSLYNGAAPRAYLSLGGGGEPAFVQDGVSAANSYAVTLGAAPAAGDSLVAAVFGNAASPALAPGWTAFAVHTPTSAGNDPYLILAYHYVGSGESATQTPATGATSQYGAMIVEVSGVAATFLDSLQGATFGASATSSSPSVTLSATTTTPNVLAISFPAAAGNSSFPGSAVPGMGWTGGTWSNPASVIGNNGAGILSAGVATQDAPTSGTAVTATTGYGPDPFRSSTISAALVLLQPSARVGAEPLSMLSTLKANGSAVETDPVSLDVTTGLALTSDGAGHATLAAQVATASQLGVVKTDGTTIAVDGAGVLSVPVAPIAANSVLGNGTGSSAAPSAQSMPSCSTSSSALTWTTSSGFGCNTISGGGSLTLTDGTNTVAGVTQITVSGGTVGGTTPNATLAVTGGGGGGLVLLEQHTASASSSLNFTTAISGSYDEYVIEFVEILPAVNNDTLMMRVSTNGGSSYDSSSSYKYAYSFSYGSGSTGSGGSTSDTSIAMSGNIQNNSMGLSGTGKLFNPLGTTLYKAFIWDHQIWNSNVNTLLRLVGGGGYISTAAVNALQFKFNSGTIASGTIRIYGLAH